MRTDTSAAPLLTGEVFETLRPADVESFRAIGVSPYMLTVANVRRVSHDEARALCGIRYKSEHLEGIAFPYLNPENDQVVTWRVRRDHPEVETDGKPIAKYVSPPDRRHLYFAPDCYPQLADTSTLAIIVEAEKSVLAIAEAENRTNRRRSLVIGTGGDWGWRGVVGKAMNANGARVDEKGPLPDFDRVAWRDRDVVILFDSNAAANPQVQAARRALAKDLTSRGALVRIAELPIEDGINGPDDYIGTHGDAPLWELVDGARPMQPASAADVLRLAGLDDIHNVGLTDLEGRFRLLKEGLKGADAIRRRTVREMLVATLKAEKINGAAALADAAIAGLDETDLGTTAAGFLANDEPWPEPVDGTALLDTLVETVTRYVVLPHLHAARAIVLWVVLTYFDAVVNLLPLLLVTSPTKRCGKTKTVEVVGGLACRALPVSNITAAALYRAIDKFHPTLLLDEGDMINDN